MTDLKQTHLRNLSAAVAQFRLATAVRLAVTFEKQPLDLPLTWTHGHHTARYLDLAMTQRSAESAAAHLQRTATFLMASTALEALKAVLPNPKSHSEPNVVAAYQIARLVRNAFAHAPFVPVWRIDSDCHDRVFRLASLITLNTAGLDGQPFDWRQYGGPLALLSLATFVAEDILGGQRPSGREIPLPETVYVQQGDLIFKRVTDSDHSSP